MNDNDMNYALMHLEDRLERTINRLEDMLSPLLPPEENERIESLIDTAIERYRAECEEIRADYKIISS